MFPCSPVSKLFYWTEQIVFDVDWNTALADSEGAKDNRNLCDRNDNQKLSRDEIEEMKQKGLSRKVLCCFTQFLSRTTCSNETVLIHVCIFRTAAESRGQKSPCRPCCRCLRHLRDPNLHLSADKRPYFPFVVYGTSQSSVFFERPNICCRIQTGLTDILVSFTRISWNSWWKTAQLSRKKLSLHSRST